MEPFEESLEGTGGIEVTSCILHADSQALPVHLEFTQVAESPESQFVTYFASARPEFPLRAVSLERRGSR